jgi:PQQ enzyme repeat
MRISIRVAVALIAAAFASTAGAQERGVLTYHNDAARSGHFVVPGLTWEKARALRPATGFAARVAGHLYAQPLVWRAGSNTMVITASEDDVVQAFDVKTGNELWRRVVGTPVPRSSLPCGNISPLGITGTPVIDPASEAIYLNAMVQESNGPRHRVFGLALKDGAVLPGFRSTSPTRCARMGSVSRRAFRTSAPRSPSSRARFTSRTAATSATAAIIAAGSSACRCASPPKS